MHGWFTRYARFLHIMSTSYPRPVLACLCVCPCVRYCSGSLEPESSCHDRDWIMELPMEADILTFTGILTPEDASVASCSPLISRSAYAGSLSSVCLHYTPLYHRGRETSSCPGRHFSNPENTNASWRLPNLYPESYGWGLPDHRLVDWPHGLTSLDRPRGLAGGQTPPFQFTQGVWLEATGQDMSCFLE